MSRQAESALRFVEKDFDQTIQQLRHLQSQVWEITRFTFTAQAALVTLAFYALKLEADSKGALDMAPGIYSALAAAILFGISGFCLLLRNKRQSIRYARYVTQLRSRALEAAPAWIGKGVEDPSNRPWMAGASQTQLALLTSSGNGLVLYMILDYAAWPAVQIVVSAMGLFAAHAVLWAIIWHLLPRAGIQGQVAKAWAD